MSELPPESYILSIPETQQTEELSRSAMLERIARGEIGRNHWVWSPADQDWKQVAEIPSLRAALPLVRMPPGGPPLGNPALPNPVPFSTAPVSGALFNAAAGSTTFSGSSLTAATPALVAPPAPPRSKPSFFSRFSKKKTAPTPPKRKKVRPRRTERRQDSEGFPVFGFLCSLVATAVVALVLLNYQFVDRPFNARLSQTPFLLVQAHAYLGSLVQPDKLMIYVLPSAEITRTNLPDFLFTLARSTPPPAPVVGKPFALVFLTSSWREAGRGQDAFSGDDWRQLGGMVSSTSDQRKAFVIDHLNRDNRQTPGGDPAARDDAWAAILHDFQVASP